MKNSRQRRRTLSISYMYCVDMFIDILPRVISTHLMYKIIMSRVVLNDKGDQLRNIFYFFHIFLYMAMQRLPVRLVIFIYIIFTSIGSSERWPRIFLIIKILFSS